MCKLLREDQQQPIVPHTAQAHALWLQLLLVFNTTVGLSGSLAIFTITSPSIFLTHKEIGAYLLCISTTEWVLCMPFAGQNQSIECFIYVTEKLDNCH